MILILHIIFAVISLFYSVFTLFSPSDRKIKNIYYLTVVTLASGVYLVATTPGNIEAYCLSGLLYIGIIAICITFGKRSLSYLH